MDKKSNILIVDDYRVNRRLLETTLQEHYKVFTATNGTDALEICTQEDIDLVLLDIMMPGMDGYEVCERLKGNLTTKHIPVIFLTSKDETEDIVKGFEVGGVDYVTKPFNQVELLARIKTHVELKTLRGVLPFCCLCGLIWDKTAKDGNGGWINADTFVSNNTDAKITHGYCPDCAEKEINKFKANNL